MERNKDLETESLSAEKPRLPRIVLPPCKPPRPEELERRRALAEEVRVLRKKIGPLGHSVTDFIREDRDNL